MSQSVALPAQPAQPEPITPPVLALPSAPEPPSAKAFHKRAKEIAREVRRFVKENPDLVVTLRESEHPYPKREVSQFCAGCYGTTAMISKTEEIISDHGEELGFIAIAHALDYTGRVISGAEAACMYSEPDWAGKPSYQLRSMCQTRGGNKVLCNVYAYVLHMAGLSPTPAEEMGGTPSKKRDRQQFKTQCGKSDCGNMISEKRRIATMRKFGQALCIDCEQKHHAEQGEKILEPLNDPAQVEAHLAQVKKRKANGKPQPIVAAMDAGKEEIA
jgi:hypothetical protein